MNKKLEEIRTLAEEAQFIKEMSLDLHLIKVFCKDTDGSEREKKVLKKLKKELMDNLYTEIIYILTHKIIRNTSEAKKMYECIIDHRNALSKQLNRNVGIEVAVLDYMKNIHSMIEQPEIIEKDKLNALAEKAVTDKTTGMYDRDILDNNLESEIERCNRFDRTFSILFCDIDNFKNINDQYGHVVGDQILQKISQLMRANLRNMDGLYKYGGEEFVIILPETKLSPAHILAKRICRGVAKFKHTINDNIIHVTLSIGVVQYEKELFARSQDIIKKADESMYKAKKQGKNQVCLFEPHKKVSKKKKKEANLKRSPKRTVLAGNPISSGYALGKAYIYKDILTRDILFYDIEEHEVDDELERIEDAISFVHKDLEKLKKIVKADLTENHAEIFSAHQQILKDSQLLEDVEFELRNELINAEHVVRNIFRKWANRFMKSQNEAVRSKSDDLEDLSRKIIRVLLGYEKNVLEELPSQSIVVAKRLLPSDTVHLKKRYLKGIVVQEGSVNSHSAILSRALGIPALSNVDKPIDFIQNKDELLLNSEQGTVIVHPNKEDKKNYRRKHKAHVQKRQNVLKKAKQPAKSRSGKKITVYANVSSLEDTKEALVNGADGVGLFRTEQIYLESKHLPDEEYLIKKMTPVLKETKNKICTIRLLDIGGDKQLSYLDMEEEKNPFLGVRGVRFLLANKNLLETQVKAILRLSKKFSVRILIPMVTLPKEIREVKTIVKKCYEELKLKDQGVKLGQIGVMIETPAAIFTVEKFIDQADFISIGTNDLIQYIMAAGRENAKVVNYYSKGADLIIDIIQKIVSLCQKKRKECSVCGEIASDVKMIKKLMQTDVSTLSVSSHCLPEIKERIRNS